MYAAVIVVILQVCCWFIANPTDITYPFPIWVIGVILWFLLWRVFLVELISDRSDLSQLMLMLITWSWLTLLLF